MVLIIFYLCDFFLSLAHEFQYHPFLRHNKIKSVTFTYYHKCHILSTSHDQHTSYMSFCILHTITSPITNHKKKLSFYLSHITFKILLILPISHYLSLIWDFLISCSILSLTKAVALIYVLDCAYIRFMVYNKLL